MTLRDLPALTITELGQLLRARDVSPREAVQAVHDRIAEIDSQIGAYLSADLDAALQAADAADTRLPLGGVPIAIKDIINVAGQPCTCASRILRNFVAPYDATVITRLKAAGAIPFGKTNMDEFAMGSSNENSSVKPVHNPWDRAYVPGGSSGGSAAAVAADEAFGALGTDTGGSVRQPAAFCGIVGLKPSYGRVSRFGVVAFASSLDQVGPLAKTVRDSATLLNAIAGHDAQESTSLPADVPDYTAALGRDIGGMRIGVAREHRTAAGDSQVQAAIDVAIEQFSSLGAEIVEVSLPHTEYAVAVYYLIATAEASANLARFDGVRYGHRAADAKDLLELYGCTRAEGFGPEVKRRIVLGTYVLSSGYYDAYYLRAQKVRELIRRDFANVFANVDALLSPSSPVPAYRIGEHEADPFKMYLADIFTVPANLAGLCGISLPCGFAESESGTRLPIGLQLLGKSLDEARLLQIAYAFEQSTDWHKQRPPLARTAEAQGK